MPIRPFHITQSGKRGKRPADYTRYSSSNSEVIHPPRQQKANLEITFGSFLLNTSFSEQTPVWEKRLEGPESFARLG